MKITSAVSLVFCWAWLSCSSGARDADGRDTTAAAPADSGQTANAVPQRARPEGPLVGDTLDLYSVGGLPLPWQDVQARPCDPAEPPAFERLIFLDDSTYRGARARRAACQLPPAESADTLSWASLYRLHGDTLTLYVGDGDEVFQSYNGRVFADSVVQFDVERSRLARYMRRRTAGHGALGASSQAPESPPRDVWARADSATVRLPPAAFPQLPQAVRADLERRQCRVPQTYMDTTPANAVRGAFRRPGEMDWAVLCSRNDTSRILVYWGGAPESPDSLATEPDRDQLQSGVGSGVGYSRALGVASPAYIRRHHEWYGGPTPPPLDHDGVNDIFAEKGSTVWYWYRGRWLELTGAD